MIKVSEENKQKLKLKYKSIFVENKKKEIFLNEYFLFLVPFNFFLY